MEIKGSQKISKKDGSFSIGKVTSSVSAPMPAGQFRITRDAYHKFLRDCRGGDMTYVRLVNPIDNQSTNVILFGANFDDDFPLKNLYKALNVVRPDTLLLQIRPDVAFQGFNDCLESDDFKASYT